MAMKEIIYSQVQTTVYLVGMLDSSFGLCEDNISLESRNTHIVYYSSKTNKQHMNSKSIYICFFQLCLQISHCTLYSVNSIYLQFSDNWKNVN